MDDKMFILTLLHSLAAVTVDKARSPKEIVKYSRLAVDKVVKLLQDLEAEGYVIKFQDRYYLTATGSIKVASMFS